MPPQDQAYTNEGITAGMPVSARGQTTKIDVDPTGKNLLYCSGRSVFIRNIKNPSIAVEYTGHIVPTTVARFSPSGYYVASGDTQGNVRVWDCVGTDKVLKLETRVIAGRINDIAWDGESKRIFAVGDGKERYGHVFAYDMGSSAGEVSGHSKVINAVAIKPQRPFRAVTVSDDMTAVFFHGAPYKFNRTIRAHSRFIQDVAYSFDGEHFVTVGSDCKVVLCDGKTGDIIAEFNHDQGHTGTVYAVSFSPDSKFIVTSSADATVKVWDVTARAVIETYTIESQATFEHHQVANAWSKDGTIISMSLNGTLHFIDRSAKKEIVTLRGHQRTISALARAADGTVYTGSTEGIIYSWKNNGAESAVRLDNPHSTQVIALSLAGSSVYSIGLDDTIKSRSGTASTGFQPKALAAVAPSNTYALIVVATIRDLQLHKDQKGILNKVASTSTAEVYTPQAVAIHSNQKLVAVGAADDAKIRIYSISDSAISSTPVSEFMSSTGPITSLAYSPIQVDVGGKLIHILAAGSSTGKIHAFNEDGKAIITEWVFHTSRINSLQFSKDGQFCVSSSLDTNVIVYSVQKPMRNVQIKNAHILGVTCALWTGDDTLVSSGADACLKRWKVKLPKT